MVKCQVSHFWEVRAEVDIRRVCILKGLDYCLWYLKYQLVRIESNVLVCVP